VLAVRSARPSAGAEVEEWSVVDAYRYQQCPFHDDGRVPYYHVGTYGEYKNTIVSCVSCLFNDLKGLLHVTYTSVI
jgi:hypothetical protein